MAIEDHPDFPEWAEALKALTRAWDDYSSGKAFGYADEIADLEAAVIDARRRYNEASDKIDAMEPAPKARGPYKKRNVE